MLTIADAFTGAAALGPCGRAALAQLLGGRRGAIDQASLGDIDDIRHRRSLNDKLVAAVAEGGVLDRIADRSLAVLAPGASLLVDAEIGAHEGSLRLLNLLARQHVHRWSTLLGLRVEDVRRWSQTDTGTTAEIVGLAFARGLAGLVASRQDAKAAGAALDVAVLLEHEQTASSQPLLDALTALAGEGAPDGVRGAATRLLTMVPGARSHADVLTRILGAAGDARDVEVFAERNLQLRHRATLEETAQRIGLSAERVRQLRRRAEGRVRAAAATAPGDSRALVGEVRRWLGTAVPTDVADGVARRLGAGSAHTRVGGLLLWLAGPYQPVPGRDGWLAVEPAQIVASTAAWLGEDGGVRPVQEVHDELAAEGVRPEHHDAWLAACGGVVVDDMVAYVAGALATVAERVLFAAGRGMAVSEIAPLLAPGRDEDVHATLIRDRRFVRVGADVFELSEWGGATEPSTTASEPTTPTTTPSTPATAPTSTDGRTWLRVSVDDDLMRGALPAPAGLADLLSALPRHRRTFTSRYGPVTIIDETPALGSLRHTALACGAQPGDDLWLGFDAAGDVSVRRRDADERSDDTATPTLTEIAPHLLTAQGTR